MGIRSMGDMLRDSARTPETNILRNTPLGPIPDPRFREAFAPSCWNAQQSWNFTSHWEFGTHRLRVRIRRNAYDEQSFAEVSKLDIPSGAWNVLRSIPISECECRTISYTHKDVKADDFSADEGKLLRMARSLLN